MPLQISRSHLAFTFMVESAKKMLRTPNRSCSMRISSRPFSGLRKRILLPMNEWLQKLHLKQHPLLMDMST